MSSIKEQLKPEDTRDLSILTKRQRAAYLLRQQKMTYKKIGEEMGITANAASELVRHAERRFREYDRYNDAKLRNNVLVDFPMTRGELIFVLSALHLLEADLQKGILDRPKSDWAGRLPYAYNLVKSLDERLQITLYGKKLYKHWEDDEDEESIRNDTTKEGKDIVLPGKQGEPT
jgi:hypothetical protein